MSINTEEFLLPFGRSPLLMGCFLFCFVFHAWPSDGGFQCKEGEGFIGEGTLLSSELNFERKKKRVQKMMRGQKEHHPRL